MKQYLVVWASGRREIVSLPTLKGKEKLTKPAERLLEKYKSVPTVKSIKMYDPLFDGGVN